jgi:hypothetical protein
LVGLERDLRGARGLVAVVSGAEAADGSAVEVDGGVGCAESAEDAVSTFGSAEESAGFDGVVVGAVVVSAGGPVRAAGGFAASGSGAFGSRVGSWSGGRSRVGVGPR